MPVYMKVLSNQEYNFHHLLCADLDHQVCPWQLYKNSMAVRQFVNFKFQILSFNDISNAMINIESISKRFGEQGLFDNTGFQINSGEKIGLVGRNGHGKTTLLRMITGEEEPETGTICIPGDYRIGCLSQKIDFSEDTVLDECMQGLSEHDL